MKFKILQGKEDLFLRKDSKIILKGICGIWDKDAQTLKIYTGNSDSDIDWTQNTITLKTIEGVDVLEIINEGEDFISGGDILLDLPFNYIRREYNQTTEAYENRVKTIEADIETEIVDTEYLESNGKTVALCFADYVVDEGLSDSFVDKESWERYIRSQREGSSLSTPYLDEYGRIITSEYSWEVYEKFTGVSLRGGYSSYFGEVPFIELIGTAVKKVYKHCLEDTVTSTSTSVSVKEVPGVEIVVSGNQAGITIDNENLRVYFNWDIVDESDIFYIYLKAYSGGRELTSDVITFGYLGGDIVEESKTSAFPGGPESQPVFVFQNGTKHSIYLKCKSVVPTDKVSILPNKFDFVANSGRLDGEAGGYLTIEFSQKEELSDEEAEKFEIKVDDITIYSFYAGAVSENNSIVPVSDGYGDSAIYVSPAEGDENNLFGTFGLITNQEDLVLYKSSYVPISDPLFSRYNIECSDYTGGSSQAPDTDEINTVPSSEPIDISDFINGSSKSYYVGSRSYEVILPTWAGDYKVDDGEWQSISEGQSILEVSGIDDEVTYYFREGVDTTATLIFRPAEEEYTINTIDSDILAQGSAKARQIGVLYAVNDGGWTEVLSIIPIYLKPTYKIDNSITLSYPGTIPTPDPWNFMSEIASWETGRVVRTYTDFNIVLNGSETGNYVVDSELGSDSDTFSDSIKYECILGPGLSNLIELHEAHYENNKIYISATTKPGALSSGLTQTKTLEIKARCGGMVIDRKVTNITFTQEFIKAEFDNPLQSSEYTKCNSKVTKEEVTCPYYVAYYGNGNTYENIVGDEWTDKYAFPNYFSTKIIISSKELNPEDIECYAQHGNGNKWSRLKRRPRTNNQDEAVLNEEVVLREIQKVTFPAGLRIIKYELSHVPSVVTDGFPVHPMKLKIGTENLYMFFLPLNPYTRGYSLCPDNNDWVSNPEMFWMDGPGQSNRTPIGDISSYVCGNIANPYFSKIKDSSTAGDNFDSLYDAEAENSKLKITWPSFFNIGSDFIDVDNTQYETPPPEYYDEHGVGQPGWYTVASDMFRVSISPSDLGSTESIFPSNLASLGIPTQGVSYTYTPVLDQGEKIVIADIQVNFRAYYPINPESSDGTAVDDEVPTFEEIFPISRELSSLGDQNVLVNEESGDEPPTPIPIISRRLWSDIEDWTQEQIQAGSLFNNSKIITVEGGLNNLSLATTNTYPPNQAQDSLTRYWETIIHASVGSRFSSSWLDVNTTRYDLEPELFQASESVLLVGDNYRYTGFNFYQNPPEWYIKSGNKVYRLFDGFPLVIEREIGSRGGDVSFDLNLYSNNFMWGEGVDWDSAPFLSESEANASSVTSITLVTDGLSSHDVEIAGDFDIEDDTVSTFIPEMALNELSDKLFIFRVTYEYSIIDYQDEGEGGGENPEPEQQTETITFDYVIRQKYNPLQFSISPADTAIYSFGAGIMEATVDSSIDVENMSILSLDPDIEIEYTPDATNNEMLLTIFPGTNISTRALKDLSIPLSIEGAIGGDHHTWNQTIECKQGCIDIYVGSEGKLCFERCDPGIARRYTPFDYDKIDIIPQVDRMEVNLRGTTYTGSAAKAIVKDIDAGIVIGGSKPDNYPYIDVSYTLNSEYEGESVIITLPVVVAIDLTDYSDNEDTTIADIIGAWGPTYDLSNIYTKELNIQIN